MPHPKTPVGRILAEQARQAIPDNLDAWPEILSRLQSEGLVEPESTNPPAAFEAGLAAQAEPLAFQPERTMVMKNSPGGKTRPTDPLLRQPVSPLRSRRLALAGLGFAAVLALFLIAISVVLFNGKTPAPVASEAGLATQGVPTPTALPATTSAATTTRLPHPPLRPTATAVPVPTPTPLAVAGLTIDGKSLNNQGKLAFIFQNNLFTLDGATGRLTR